ncbi:MAG: hypothetical protein AB8H80_15030 [Planctomycetota bacterium]
MKAPRRARSAYAAVLFCSLLVLLLPPLVAGLSIGSDATPGELARMQRIVGPSQSSQQQQQQQPSPPAVASERVDTGGSRLFHTATLGSSVGGWPDDSEAQQALVVQARLAQVFGLGALALLTYLSVLLARGRLQALFACALFSLLPPVAQAGHILRPETIATTFAMLAVVLFQAASRPAPRARSRSPLRSQAAGAGLMLCGALAAAMTCETMPSLGKILLVPGLVLVVASIQLGSRTYQCWRRRELEGTPIRAVNRRLVPWTATALLAPAMTIALMRLSWTVPVEALAVTEQVSELLPALSVASLPTFVLMLIGLVAGILRVGLRLGRRAKVGPDLILFVFCALFLMPTLAAAAMGGGRAAVPPDPLPQLPAMAVVLSEGLRTLLELAVRALRRVRGRR